MLKMWYLFINKSNWGDLNDHYMNIKNFIVIMNKTIIWVPKTWRMSLQPWFGIANHLVLISCFVSYKSGLVGKSDHLRPITLNLNLMCMHMNMKLFMYGLWWTLTLNCVNLHFKNLETFVSPSQGHLSHPVKGIWVHDHQHLFNQLLVCETQLHNERIGSKYSPLQYTPLVRWLHRNANLVSWRFRASSWTFQPTSLECSTNFMNSLT
jgi:hypothetical protein